MSDGFLNSVPPAVFEWFKKTGAGAAKSEETRQQVRSLLTKAEMDSVWRKLTRLGFKDQFGRPASPILFIVYVTEIYGSWQWQLHKTSKQLSKEMTELVADLKGLAHRVRESKADMNAELPVFVARKAWLEKQGFVLGDRDMVAHDDSQLRIPIYSDWCFDEPLFSQVLEAFCEMVEKFDCCKESSITQPKSKREMNRYFCRELSSYFKSAYGKPLHDVVASVHNTLFEGGELTEKEVGRLLSSEATKLSKR